MTVVDAKRLPHDQNEVHVMNPTRAKKRLKGLLDGLDSRGWKVLSVIHSISVLQNHTFTRYRHFTMVILITNTKGGVGKSTLAVHLLAWLSRKQQSVVLLDTDEQQTAFDWAQKALPDVPAEYEANPKSIIKLLKRLNSQFDFVVCDTPGNYSLATTMLPSYADLALVPIQPSDADIDELSKALFHIQVAKQRGAKSKPDATLVLSLTSPTDSRSLRLKKKLGELGIPVAKQTIRRLNAVRDAAKHDVVFNVNRKMHRTASNDYDKLFRNLFKRLLKSNRSRAANA